MPEIIDLKLNGQSHDEVTHFILAAVAKKFSHTDEREVFDRLREFPHEITFMVNGVELPFVETIKDIYARGENSLDKRAAIKARELIADGRFNNIYEGLYELENKLNWMLGIEMGDG